MTLVRANGQNKAMMSSKGIIRKTRELLTVAIIDPPFPIFGLQDNRRISGYLTQRIELTRQDVSSRVDIGVVYQIIAISVKRKICSFLS